MVEKITLIYKTMWSIYEIISASSMTLWIIMLLMWLIGFWIEYELAWGERAKQYVWQQWKIFHIVYAIVTIVMIVSFIFVVKFGIPK